MEHIANLLFEVRILKELNRCGYAFLGSGRESVAEHSFMTAFICFTFSKMDPSIDGAKLVAMALVHDLAEARTGDHNYVQKKYAQIDEDKAVTDLINNLSFGKDIKSLIDEFNQGKTKEAKLANDADQISFILELKKLYDTRKWLSHVLRRLKTDMAKDLADSIMTTNWDEWWTNGYSEKDL